MLLFILPFQIDISFAGGPLYSLKLYKTVMNAGMFPLIANIKLVLLNSFAEV